MPWASGANRRSRLRSAVIVVSLVVAIGTVDYLTGYWFSFQLFYLVPTLLAVTWFGWQAGAAVAATAVSVRLGGDIAAGILTLVRPLPVLWNRLAELVVFLILIWAFHRLISLQHTLERRVRQRTTALNQAVEARDQLQKQMMEIGRRERSAIGRDLHDGLGQHLTATAMAATVLERRLATGNHPLAPDARRVVQLIQDSIARTRDIARGLLLARVEPRDLALELEELAARIRQEHPLDCTFSQRGDTPPIDVATSSHLFYIAQEAARNTVRHAQASHLAISLVADDTRLELAIADDGAGLPSDHNPSGMGLRIMSHRSELIGAEFQLVTAPGRGVCIRCLLPLPSASVSAPS